MAGRSACLLTVAALGAASVCAGASNPASMAIRVAVSPHPRYEVSTEGPERCAIVSSLSFTDFTVEVETPQHHLPLTFRLRAETDNCPGCDLSEVTLDISVTRRDGEPVDFSVSGTGGGFEVTGEVKTHHAYLSVQVPSNREEREERYLAVLEEADPESLPVDTTLEEMASRLAQVYVEQEPGRYDLVAGFTDPVSGARYVSAPMCFEVRYADLSTWNDPPGE